MGSSGVISDSQEKRGNLWKLAGAGQNRNFRIVCTSMATISKMKWIIDRAPTLPGSRFAFWGSAASAALQICNCSFQVWSLLQCAFWMYTWPPFACGWCGVDRLPGRLAIFPLDLDRARGCSLRLGKSVSHAQEMGMGQNTASPNPKLLSMAAWALGPDGFNWLAPKNIFSYLGSMLAYFRPIGGLGFQATPFTTIPARRVSNKECKFRHF